ncbi:MAG TPA: DNA-binding response regulator [Firmicutes bacterium]|jgi:two-component system response regulator YesN|nr:DNA-binding response regulator [Bacillota bacterium]HBT16009.1 DNA-binding response regulator [Bacillota bacterium]
MHNVVVVEDEDIVRKGLVITTPWEDFDCKVIGEAENGLAGIELIFKLKPDIVFTDIRMSGMDGLTMIHNAQKKVNAEYVIISGYNEFEYAKRAMTLGVKEFLVKPIDELELEKVLERLISEIKKKEHLEKLRKGIQNIDDNKLLFFKEYFSSSEGGREDYISEAVKYIRENFQKDISIKDVAEYLHISESYLSRLFKNETNYTFIEYLTNFRLKKTLELLRDKEVKIYEIASLVGYNDSRYFSGLFKRYLGMTPREFRDFLN